MSQAQAPARTQRLAVAGVFAVAIGIAMASPGTGQVPASAQTQSSPDGGALFTMSCASCHGPRGTGTRTGPSLLEEGPAAVDWVLRTGRMPLSAPEDQAVARSKTRYDRGQIDAIISHLQSLGMKGPAIPDVDLSGADIVNGGEIFRRNCASCHQAVAQGGAVNGGRDAPSLQGVDALTIHEVLRVGPGVMPRFTELDAADVADVSAWVTQVGQEPDDRGGAGIGHIGPVAEGLAIWLVIAVGVLGTVRWIGDKAAGEIRADPVEVAVAAHPGARVGSTGGPRASAGSAAKEQSSTTRIGSWLVVLAAGGALVVRWVKQRRDR